MRVRKLIGMFLVVIILLSIPNTSFAANFASTNGILRISGLQPENAQKIIAEKDGNKLYYNILKETETIPMQLGDGNYIIKILKHKEGNTYTVVKKTTVNIEGSTNVFLSSSQPVYWTENDEAVKLAKELTKEAKTDAEKVRIIYDYVVKNITYDYAKIPKLNNDYVPNSDNTLATKSGICYDYAALFATMLRSQGIPTKLVKGYAKGVDVFHAWNQVKVEGNWLTIDTTFNAAFVQAGRNIAMYKNALDYTSSSEY